MELQPNAGMPADLDRLLQGCSRTFALTIPLLSEPTRGQVTIAYLLFRVADIFEDATHWPTGTKLVQLRELSTFLEDPSAGAARALAARWSADPPVDPPGYRALLAEFPAVMDATRALDREAWRHIASHTARTCRAMASFVERERNGILMLADLEDLRRYCYAVAGIVGEMLTELFLLGGESLAPVAGVLRRDAVAFGEGLQLVNILKDCASDAGEGRYYLPQIPGRPEVFAMARRDLEVASDYCSTLEQAGSERGIIAFTALPILLARATLDRVEASGPGAKITRAEVAALMSRLQEALSTATVSTLLQSS